MPDSHKYVNNFLARYEGEDCASATTVVKILSALTIGAWRNLDQAVNWIEADTKRSERS
jgi:hypothetical protein